VDDPYGWSEYEVVGIGAQGRGSINHFAFAAPSSSFATQKKAV
jgi:hypothetical protein